MEESPFTKVPNSFFDIEGLNVYERLILLYIARKTIGFNKKSDGISLSQFIKFTGISKNTILKSLERLKKLNLIKIQKQTQKNGGKSFNKYTPLVHEVNHLVHEMNKGSSRDELGLVHEVNIQEENRTKENIQKRDEREGNIFFSFSNNKQLREIDRYIDHLISTEEYIKNTKAFGRKIKKQLLDGEKYQIEDFEKWYLNKTCEELGNKYIGKYLDSNEIVNIYPYFHTEDYDPSNKFIIKLIDIDTKEKYFKVFKDGNELEKILKGVVDGII